MVMEHTYKMEDEHGNKNRIIDKKLENEVLNVSIRAMNLPKYLC